MNIENIPFMANFIRIARDASLEGWHERNGGNLSYRLSKEDLGLIEPWRYDDPEHTPLQTLMENLAGEVFLVTGSGKFMRHIELDPSANIGLIEIDRKGSGYRTVWGLTNNSKPSSELLTHLMTHSVKKEYFQEKYRVLMHVHPVNIIALSFVLPLESNVFSRELWEMMTECAVVFPEGIGVLRWMLPGSYAIAKASSELMKRCNAILWAHHGIFCAGETLDLAFGLIETIEKAAEILVKVISMGGKNQRISKRNLMELDKTYRLNLDIL